MKLKELVGSGDRIILLTLPFLVIGLILNIMFPSLCAVGGPSTDLKGIMRKLSVSNFVTRMVTMMQSVVKPFYERSKRHNFAEPFPAHRTLPGGLERVRSVAVPG